LSVHALYLNPLSFTNVTISEYVSPASPFIDAPVVHDTLVEAGT